MAKIWDEVKSIEEKYSLNESDYTAGRKRREYIRSMVKCSDDIQILRLPMSGSFKKRTAVKVGEKRPDVDILCIAEYNDKLTPRMLSAHLYDNVKDVKSYETRSQSHSIGLKYKSGLDIDLVLIMEDENGSLLVGNVDDNIWKKTYVEEHNERIEKINKYDSVNSRKVIRSLRISCKQLNIEINSFIIDSIVLDVYKNINEKTDAFKVFVMSMERITSGISHYEEIIGDYFPTKYMPVENKLCIDLLDMKSLDKLDKLFPNENMDLTAYTEIEEQMSSLKTYGVNNGLYTTI